MDMVFDKPYWLFFPKGTDQAILDKANEALMAVCADPAYAAELKGTMQTFPGDMTRSEAIELSAGYRGHLRRPAAAVE